mmetsp:Transcript_51010/g.163833  ORF Transcript_51010/g.163833 Transcript_51010/m.163833 type:complete len:310 (+) Transcript_51010:899-1828(+)
MSFCANSVNVDWWWIGDAALADGFHETYDDFARYSRLIRNKLGFHNSAPHHYWGLYFFTTMRLRQRCQLGFAAHTFRDFNLGRFVKPGRGQCALPARLAIWRPPTGERHRQSGTARARAKAPEICFTTGTHQPAVASVAPHEMSRDPDSQGVCRLQRLGRERLRRHVPDRNDAPRLPQPQPSRLTAEWRMRRAGGGAMRRAAARCAVRRGSCGPRADAPPRVLVSTRRKCEPALLAILKRGGAPQGGCLADTIPLQREQQPDAHAGGRALCATDGPHQRQQGRASSSTHAEAHDLKGATPPARLHAPQH